MRGKHDLNTWVVFVGLIKAFDSINHKLLFALLEKFGIPTRPLNVIIEIEITLGIKNHTTYSAGVK